MKKPYTTGSMMATALKRKLSEEVEENTTDIIWKGGMRNVEI